MNSEPERCTYCGKTRADHWMNAAHHEPIMVEEIIERVLAEQPSEMALLFRRLITDSGKVR